MTPAPSGRRLHDLVRMAAARHPERVALDRGDARLSYAELDSLSDRVAAALTALGATVGTRVGLCTGRTLDACVGLVGVLKSGATVVPLDPADPPGRLARLVQGAALTMVVADDGALPAVRRLTAHAVRLSDLAATPPGPAGDAIPPSACAYILHTSGSTGAPKAVMVSHSAATAQLDAIARAFGLESSDRVLQFASFSFDVAFEELFGAWAVGATVVLRTTGFTRLLEHFSAHVREQRITVVDVPASFWHEWVTDLAEAREPVPDCLRLVVVGSEPVSAQRAREWFGLPGRQPLLVNAYGTTESTITNLIYPCRSLEDVRGDRVPVGWPVGPHVRTRLVDDDLREVARGATGELCICGPTLALGYYGAPEETRARFLTTPGREEERMYRTGDLARETADGAIDVVGRLDNEVQLHGHRVAPEEVESTLVEVAGGAAWAGPVDVGGETRLAAVVAEEAGAGTAEPDQARRGRELRERLKELLPAYMVPTVVVVVREMPRSPAGTIAVDALRDLAGAHARLQPPASPPAGGPAVTSLTVIERRVAAAWSDVLGIDHVDPDLNFFDHGGDSLSLMRVYRRLSREIAPDLEVTDLFEHTTVRAIAALIAHPTTA